MSATGTDEPAPTMRIVFGRDNDYAWQRSANIAATATIDGSGQTITVDGATLYPVLLERDGRPGE